MILVTGDVVLDHNIYAGQRFTPDSDAAPAMQYRMQAGGAMLTHGLLAKLRPESEIVFGLADVTVNALQGWPSGFQAGAEWAPFDGPKKGSLHWKLSRNLGYGARSKPAYPAGPAAGLDALKPRVLVIDDGGLGFRLKTASHCWPGFLTAEADGHQPDWIVLKMSRPLVCGDLWRELAARWRERLIILVSADDLRKEEVRISRGLSWESTVDDLVDEIQSNPAVRGLQMCRHLVVTLRGDAALWFEAADDPGQRRCQLVFDPKRGEGEWEDSQNSGNAFGFLSAVTAALASRLADNRSGERLDIVPALKAGLSTARFLREYGHGSVSGLAPGFPFQEAAAHLSKPQHHYAAAEVAAGSRAWTMLSQAARIQGPMFGPSRRLALFGPAALDNVPCARFGKLLTMDRREIESLRCLRQLMLSYRNGGPQKQPLSLAVFGAPGSGKSFGLKQIAEGVFGDKNPVLEFNLSQFVGPEDLIGAYHQVRDKVLAGWTPVVFWDEFDSRNFYWLQYLLAPMQDGTFQEGQLSHTIGKCVFVFAGGTSRDFEHFGPPEAQAEASRAFAMAKGPDFKSRLAGFLDVLGPNPRQLYSEDSAGLWRDDGADSAFPVRRAILLRSLLGLVGEKENAPLAIDRGLLTALLETTHYRNGARSMEKLISQIRDRGGVPLRRAHLPPDHLLALYVEDVQGFHALMRQSYAFRHQAELLAPILHQDWRDNLQPHEKGGAFDVPYEGLDQEGKAANVAAALRIPETLALVGFVLESGAATDDEDQGNAEFLKQHIELLAEAEHNGWEEQKRMEGWTYGPLRDDAARTHPLLVSYAALPEPQKDKDRRTIMNYPRYACKAGFNIISRRKGHPGV